MRVFGPRELVQDVQDRGLCVACGACVGLCPYFGAYRGKIAMLFPCDLPSGRCHAFCPKAEVDLDGLSLHFWKKPYEEGPLGRHVKIITARSGRPPPGSGFQAGGTVSSIMAFALREGLIDAAVLTGREGLIPLPQVVTHADEVASCASSKYTAAPTLSAYHEAVRHGHTRIGVVGTPCQTTALALMRMSPLPPPQDEFTDPVGLVVGLFCTWALDTRPLLELLSKRLEPAAVTRMDIPPPPAGKMVIETGGGNLEIPLEEVRPLVPKGCLLCPDMTAEWADISVGVLESDPGMNTVVIRTEKGMEVVDRAIDKGWLEAGPMPGEGLEHLCSAAAAKRRRALVRAMEEGLLNTQGEARSCLRLNPAALEKILAS